MGEAPEVRGFFLGCGFNSAGETETAEEEKRRGGAELKTGLASGCAHGRAR